MSRVRRPAAVAAIVLLGAGLLAACSGATPFAAIVNGTKISQSTLVQELNALGGNPGFVTAYDGGVAQAASQGQTISPIFASGTASTKTYTQGFTAIVLNTDIQAELIHEEVVRRHIEPTAAEISAATAVASQQFPNDAAGKSVFPQFNAWFQTEYKERQAEHDALDKALGVVASDTAAIKAFYDQNPQDFINTECVSHILVPTEAQIVSIRRQIVAGADFGTQARKYSTDTASGAKGGDLGCAAPGGYVPEFERIADTIAVNQLSQPVHSQFGWHLIEVRSRQLLPLDATNSGRIQQFLKGESPGSAFVTAALRTATVSVNAAYGTWDTVLHGVVAPIPPPAAAGAPSSGTSTTVPETFPTTPATAPGTSAPGDTTATSAPGDTTPATSPPGTSAPGTSAPGGSTPTSGP